MRITGWSRKMPAIMTSRSSAMTQQTIIRRVTTMDRGPLVRVTTAEVLKIVEAHRGEFSSFDISEKMGVPEYPVRAAMSWLLNRRVIEKVGTRKRYTALRHEVYWATTYRVREKSAPVDFRARRLTAAGSRGRLALSPLNWSSISPSHQDTPP